MTDPARTRAVFERAGVQIASLATSVRLDDPIRPKVVGRTFLFDQERSVREARRLIDMAGALGASRMRIFGFEVGPGETRASTTKLILSRLAMVVDHARNRRVRIVLENGGSYPRVAELKALIDAGRHQLLGASYALAPGIAAGDSPQDAAAMLGRDLELARIKDLDAHGHPVPLGQGQTPVRDFVAALSKASFDGWMIYEWDRAWDESLAGADSILPGVAEKLYQWAAPAAAAPAPAMA
jgi:sugar phosphate isomerase/epimerase